MIVLVSFWSRAWTGARQSFSFWPVVLILWLLNTLVLIPLLLPLFLYLYNTLPDPYALSVTTDPSLLGGSRPQDWEAMSISLFHDLMLPFTTTAAGSLRRSLISLPLILYIALQPFWQAGLWNTLRSRLTSTGRSVRLWSAFFRGIGQYGPASFRIALWLTPLWLGLWQLYSYTSNLFDEKSWGPVQATIIAVDFILVVLFLASLISLIGDLTRWQMIFHPSEQGKPTITLLMQTVPQMIRQLAPLLVPRIILYGFSMALLFVITEVLDRYPAAGIKGIFTALFLQQAIILILFFTRIAALITTVRQVDLRL
ncbi:hypothetical protein H1S01_00385 [Heliobacterium chlorum]|uniref:Uncharacterized protein n=1 Tax=Heliobacterium chlorum TaxID=2698 RepID=A0ABR7SYM5_HELCL|nr:hypothetical protein [Heliobacterium chlorum]MBC9782962.1 hypothetical protein [Heliobacterium chlorum]